ncbi:MAG: carbohydrate-binding domain-containing protein [Lachnospiraceae bacterium]|nr:carbohydrate-binding domain-containing protein [Lachnospiraceae bacterium]
MSTHRNFDRICVAVILCAMILTVLFMNGEKFGIQTVSAQAAQTEEGTEYFTQRDLDGDWNVERTTVISLQGSSAKISGQGAYAADGDVYITGAGYYLVTGTLDNGSIIVNAYKTSDVFIMLDGVSITCEDDAALQVDQADNVYLTLKEGSTNTLSSGSTYSEEAINDGCGGVIYAHDDLTINGSGSLTIMGEYQHGIEANDELIITGGKITIDVPGDGLHANDSIRITEAELTINAGDDAIHCDTEIIVVSGTILIESCYEGLEAPQIDVQGGTITIYPEDDGFNANGGTDMFGMGGMNGGMHGGFGGGNMGGGFDGSQTDAAESTQEENAAQSEENAAQSKEETVQSQEETSCIRISGGEITIINDSGRDADGLDSNGDIYISGGTILISLADSGSNNAIDYGSESGGVCEISGGTVIACGSSSMAESFDSSSTQLSVLYNPGSSIEAGTIFSVEDAEGNELISWEVPNSFSSVNVSIPEFEEGGTYTLIAGDTSSEVTLEDIVTTDGTAGGMGGMNQMGGAGFGGKNDAADSTGDFGGNGGFGRGGMGGRHGQMQEGEMPEGMGERPEGMELPEGMERPEGMQIPEGMERPEGMQMPEGSERSEGMMQRHGNEQEAPGVQNAGSTQERSSQTASGGTTLADLDDDTLVRLSASAGVLAAGITAALLYKKRR